MYEHTDTLPCLRCESDALIVPVIGGVAVAFTVRCPVCGYGETVTHDSETAAIDNWNGGPEHRLALDEIRSARWSD